MDNTTSVPDESVPTICLIANVGQRDLQVDGEPLDKRKLREEGQRILDGYAAHKGRIRAPMIEAAMDFVHRQDGSTKFGSVLLVATDQENERFRGGDTITCAEVIQRYLHDQRHSLIAKLPGLIKVTGTPNQYDRMLKFYRERVAGHRQAGGDPVYVLCSGGTPACNTALLLSAVERFRERCVVLNVSEENTTVTPLAIGRQLLDTYRAEGLDRLLERYDFAGVAALAGVHENVRALARAASARVNLDFTASYDAMVNLRSRAVGLPADFESLYGDSIRLDQEDPEAALREVYWNAWLKWETDACADFLGRVWRLIEASLYRCVGRVCGIEFENEKKARYQYRKWMEAQAGLGEYLAGAVCPDNPSTWRPDTSVPNLTHTLNWLVEGNMPDYGSSTREAARQVASAVQVIEKATTLRNKSVIAHGFAGLSHAGILDVLQCSENELFAAMKSLLEAQDIAIGVNPYRIFADVIRHVSGHGRN